MTHNIFFIVFLFAYDLMYCTARLGTKSVVSEHSVIQLGLHSGSGSESESETEKLMTCFNSNKELLGFDSLFVLLMITLI